MTRKTRIQVNIFWLCYFIGEGRVNDLHPSIYMEDIAKMDNI